MSQTLLCLSLCSGARSVTRDLSAGTLAS